MSSDTIHIDVDFYDPIHQVLLSKYPSFSKIQQCVRNGIDIPLEEFYAYYLFHRTGSGGGPIDYDTFARQTYKSKVWLDGQLTLEAGALAQAPGVEKLPNEIVEHTGEAVGLSVASRAFDLTAADWQRIPAGKMKTFDFAQDMASDGSNKFQLETKGSATPLSLDLKTNSMSQQKASIEEKKTSIASAETAGTYPHPADWRLGTIAVIPRAGEGNAKCWLLDPEPFPSDFAPRKLRLVNRLTFLHRWLSFISPHSAVASALSNRLEAVRQIVDPDQLSGSRLQSGVGTPIEPRYTYARRQDRLTFFATKSVVLDGPAGGVVAQASRDRFFFWGVMEEVVTQAMAQDFDEILGYRRTGGIRRKTVVCVFSNSRLRRLQLPPEIERTVNRARQYSSFELSGNLHYSETGLVFGVLEPLG